jgi:hypothetical protein
MGRFRRPVVFGGLALIGAAAACAIFVGGASGGSSGCSCTEVHVAMVELSVGTHVLTLEGSTRRVSFKELVDVAKTLTPSPRTPGTPGTRATGGSAVSSATPGSPWLSVDFGSDPMGDAGRRVTYQELVAEAPFIPSPNSPLAGPTTAGSVWTTTDKALRNGGGVPSDTGHSVAAWVYYPASGIELEWFPGPGLTGEPTQTIDGVPALAQTLSGEDPIEAPVGPTGSSASQ